MEPSHIQMSKYLDFEWVHNLNARVFEPPLYSQGYGLTVANICQLPDGDLNLLYLYPEL